MKIEWNKYKCIFLILINALPFALNILFYTTGLMDDLYLFFPIFIGLTVLNFRSCDKVAWYILLQIFMLFCIICSVLYSTHLYYQNISDDYMTATLRVLFALLEATINIGTTVITAVAKVIKTKKQA